MSIAVVYSAGAGDTWRIRKSVASLRRAGVRADIVLLTLGAYAAGADPYLASECKSIVPVDGILSGLGFSPEGWGRSTGYATLACLAAPLVPQLAQYDRALFVAGDVLALRPGFSEWLSRPTRGFEVVGAAGSGKAAQGEGAYAAEADRCFPDGAAAEMGRRVWRMNPPYSRVVLNHGVHLWDLALLRSDEAWYRTRLRWFWSAVSRGHADGLYDTFAGVFMDSAALADTAMSATRDDEGWSSAAAAFAYGDQAAEDVPECEFNKAAAALGLDAAVAAVPSAAKAPARRLGKCRAGKLAVVYITDGNPDDCQRMLWSMRSVVRYSGLEFDSFVLTPGGVRIPDLADAVPQLLEHGAVRQVDDIDKLLGGLSITDAGWNRAWPFVVLYRLGIPLHGAFEGYDRVLYLDTDVLVLSSRVDDFLSADISGHEVGGVVDTVQEEHGRIRGNLDRDLIPEYAAKVRARYGEILALRPYVNAGVLLWNLPEIRKDIPWYKERLRMFWEAECRGRFGFLDQDFVNSMMSVDTRFSMVYNWFTKSGIEADDGECVIRHYCAHNYEKMALRAESLGFLTKEEVMKRHGRL